MSGGFLEPSVDVGRLLPAGAAFLARTDLVETRLLGFTAVHSDGVTSLLQGVLGTLPAVRHVGGVTAEISQFLRDSGLPLREDLRPYRTIEEAEDHADQLIGEGFRLFWPYPTRAGRFADAGQLVTPAAWSRLNSKQHMADIVPAANLPPRRIAALHQFEKTGYTGPCYVKAGGELATGWGFAVRHCADAASWKAAQDWFAARRADISHVIIEADTRPEKTWCAGLGIVGGTVTCLGGSEQLFASPGHQRGNVMDCGDPMPQEAAELAILVGKTAAGFGFQGIAGLDIGRSADGGLHVFDPNFRFNSSTAQLLFHPAFADRSGLPVSLSFNMRVQRRTRDVILGLGPAVERGIFLPLRLFDCSLLPQPVEATLVTGLVSGDGLNEAEARSAELLATISG